MRSLTNKKNGNCRCCFHRENLLSLSEIGFECVTELFGVFDEFPLSDVEDLLDLWRLHRLEEVVHCVQLLLDSRRDFLDGLKEGFAVIDFIRNSAEDVFQLFGPQIQLLELGTFYEVFLKG